MPLRKELQKRSAEKTCRKDLQNRTAEKSCRKDLLDIFTLMFVLSNKSSNSANLLNTSFSQSQNARYARTPCIALKVPKDINNIRMFSNKFLKLFIENLLKYFSLFLGIQGVLA